MRYPIVIETANEDAARGVVVLDLPGCFSAGDSLRAALMAAEEAAAAWIDTTLDSGGGVPPPSPIEVIQAVADYAGWAVGVVSIDPALLDGTTERVSGSSRIGSSRLETVSNDTEAPRGSPRGSPQGSPREAAGEAPRESAR